MKLDRLTTRVLAGGATAALAAVTLVGATGTPAQAAPVSTSYNCTAFGQTLPVSATVDVTLPPTANAGTGVPAGLFAFNSTLVVPDAVQQQLNITNNTGAKSDDFGTAFGDNLAKAPVTWTKPAAADGNGNWVYTGKGVNVAFQLPKAGTYSVTMPKTFTLVTTGGNPAVTAQCVATAAPAVIGTIKLAKVDSVTKAKADKTLKQGDVESVKVKVKSDNTKTGGVLPSGKVTVKDGNKNVGKGKLENGKVTIKVKGLSVGTHTLVVSYAGDGYTNKSKSKEIKVTVTN